MKLRFRLFVLPLILAGSSAFAQSLDLQLKLNTGTYIIGEPISASLTLNNGTTSDFSSRPPLGDDILMLEITDAQRELLSPTTKTSNLQQVTVLSGDTWSDTAVLDQCFPLRKPGRYFVTLAALQENQRFTSLRRVFDVVPGLEIKSALQLFSGGEVNSRRFSLVYLARDQREFLFLRIQDTPDYRSWETLRLGSLLRTSDPRLDIAPDGTVTILHRATQDVYLKSIIKSRPETIEFVTQEQLIDPASSAQQHLEPFQVMALERQKAANNKKSWWRFGGSKK
jgi:hypothetical protein